MATTTKFWSDFFPDPFVRPNPFALLCAQPSLSPAELSAQAANMQVLADSTPLQLAYRDALRTITIDPYLRAQWEAFTSHLPPPPEGEHTSAAGRLLGQLLAGAGSVPETLSDCLKSFAAYLGWHRRMQRAGSAASERAAGWWQKATHRHASDWMWWHQLAIVYHALALAEDKSLAEHEQACSTGSRPSAPRAPSLADSYWAYTFRSWSKTLAIPAFWQSIQLHVAQSPGYDATRFDQLRQAFPEALVGSLGQLLVDAVASRNRLSAARRWRLLDGLARSQDLPEFAPLATAAKDRTASRLWTQVRQQAENPQARLEELSAGLLLVLPSDAAVVEAALVAIRETVSKEHAFTPGKYPEATRMSRLVVRHAPTLEPSVFAGADALRPSPSTDKANLLELFYHLRLRALSSGGLIPGEPVMDYQRKLELLETLEK
jgi:hypothetical protein